uniref:Uncharacterized protein n=1 Tax=Megaselia scalaris TaxID=36166 RepID=T1GUY3_MEGSC
MNKLEASILDTSAIHTNKVEIICDDKVNSSRLVLTNFGNNSFASLIVHNLSDDFCAFWDSKLINSVNRSSIHDEQNSRFS